MTLSLLEATPQVLGSPGRATRFVNRHGEFNLWLSTGGPMRDACWSGAIERWVGGQTYEAGWSRISAQFASGRSLPIKIVMWRASPDPFSFLYVPSRKRMSRPCSVGQAQAIAAQASATKSLNSQSGPKGWRGVVLGGGSSRTSSRLVTPFWSWIVRSSSFWVKLRQAREQREARSLYSCRWANPQFFGSAAECPIAERRACRAGHCCCPYCQRRFRVRARKQDGRRDGQPWRLAQTREV